MADSAIGNLPAAESILSSDLFVLEQNGSAKKLLASLLTQFIDRNVVSVNVTYVSAASTGSATYDSSTGALTLNIPKGAGVSGLEYISTTGLVDLYHLNFEGGGYTDLEVTNGSSIASITRTATGGGANHNEDTYTITLTDGTTAGTFIVTNGLDGSGTVSKVANVSPVSGNVPVASLATALQPELRIKATNVSVASVSWVSDSTYTDYPYHTDIPVLNMTDDCFAEIVFGMDDVGDFAPVCETRSSAVRVWCNGNARSELTVPTIFAWR